MADIIPFNDKTASRERLAALLPLVNRMHRGHCWRKTRAGRVDCLKETLDDAKLTAHVAGRKTYGACPMAPGTDVTRVALLDFDSHKGEVDWPAMLETAQDVAFALEQDGYLPVLFRSSGGRGIHLYLLWREPQDAYSVRTLLTDTLAALGFKSGCGGVARRQVEVFPKQDAVAPGRFGSMWILPYAGQSAPIGDFSGWRDSPPVPGRERPPQSERTVCESPALARLREALDAIPNDEDLDYDRWRNLGFAVHEATAGSDEGLTLFHAFSARSPKYDSDFIDSRFWPYVGRLTGERVTAEYVFDLAGQHGWQDPDVANDFDVLDGPTDLPVAVDPDAAPPKARFRVLDEADFLHAPPVRWLIKGLLPHAELGVLYGESGSGKSFMALDLAAAVAQGADWRGRRVRQGRVVYLAAEGAGGFRQRLRAYRQHHGIDATGVQIIAEAPNLKEKADALALCKAIAAGGKAALVIVDTLAQSFQGNENSGEDMGAVLAHCRGIGRATGAMVLLVHHSGKDAARGARGWSGLRAACDVELEVTRAESDRVLTITKQKDGEDGEAFGFKLAIVPIGTDEDGDVLSSCVVEHGEVVRRVTVRGAVQRLALDAFETLEALSTDSNGVPSNGVEREVWIRATMALLDPPTGKPDRRRDVALRAIDSLRDAGLFGMHGARWMRRNS